MGKIFVSYRRQSPHPLAIELLADLMRKHFGGDQVFIDSELAPGERYPDELRAELAASDVVLAVIHDEWLDDFDVERRMDWVRFELSTALRDMKTVIPVLLEGATQPAYDRLPADVAEIAMLESTPLRSTEYQADIAKLTAAIERTPAAPDVDLAVADPTGDQPANPGRSMLSRVVAFAVLFGAIALWHAAGLDLPGWQTLVSAAYAIVVFPLAGLTFATLVMAALQRPLNAATRRRQAISLRAGLKDDWPGYALWALGLVVVWMGLPLLHVRWLNLQVKVLVTGAVLIFVIRMAQRQVRQVSELDNAWPPPVSPDTLAFRRAATRLHELLVAKPPPRDFTTQRQAESVYFALAAVRSTVDERARAGWRRWLVGGHPGNLLAVAAVGAAGGAVVLDVAGLVAGIGPGGITRTAVLVAVAVAGVAVALTTAALVVNFRTARAQGRRLAEELRGWDTTLRPLLFPAGDRAVPAGRRLAEDG